MKKGFRILLTAALCAGLFCGSAMAAGGFVEPPVTVQLNGENLVFTDAKPQLKNERTFLPFYAVFNALGADVKWTEAEPDKVVAVRDGRTLTMNIGSTQVTVEEDGVVTTFTMDVAPYLDPATNRTYVPVFFAADALNCDVGWDPYTFTAIIVDTDALVRDAMAGKRYTWMEKLAEYSGEKTYRNGIWDLEATGTGKVTLMGAEMPMTVKAAGTVANNAQMEMDMDMTMDMSDLIALMEMMAQTGGTVSDGIDMDKVNAMAEDGIRVEMRGDLTTGMAYQRVAGTMTAGAGVDSQVWYSVPMRSTVDRMGSPVDWLSANDLQNAILAADYHAMAKAVLTERGLTDSQNSYAECRETVENLFTAFSDASFTRNGDIVTTVWALEGDGVAADLELKLTVKKEKVSLCTLTTREKAPSMTTSMEVTLTQPGEMTGVMKLDMSPLMTEEMTLTVKRTPGETLPRTQPPAGTVIRPYEGLLPVKQ